MSASLERDIVLTDTQGRLPRFLQELHRLLALGVKALRKWEGAVWDHQKTSVVELVTEQAVVEKIAYVMANPVAAGLVARAHQWPGATTRPDELGLAHWTARRPDFYFDESNAAWPASASVQLRLPPSAAQSDDELRARVADELDALERAAASDLKARGLGVVGAKRIAALSPFKRARSWEPLRALNPTFAVGRGCREAFFRAVAVVRHFRASYRAALDAWRRGVRSVPFPHGTYSMGSFHGAVTVAQ